MRRWNGAQIRLQVFMAVALIALCGACVGMGLAIVTAR
jgi:hypothetical protein